MGIPTRRPPLPRTATPEEMEADLAALRREITMNASINLTALGIGGIALIGTLVIIGVQVVGP